MSIPVVRRLLDILDRYDRAGGGLLAAGLAFSSLFALLPAILLIIGLAGLLLSDPERLAALAADLGSRFPPLAVFFEQALSGMAAGAVGNSIIGLVTLAWGASRFYDSLDNAINRIFAAGAPRNPVVRGVRGVLVIVIGIGLAMSGFVLVSFGASVAASVVPDSSPLAGLLAFLSGIARHQPGLLLPDRRARLPLRSDDPADLAGGPLAGGRGRRPGRAPDPALRHPGAPPDRLAPGLRRARGNAGGDDLAVVHCPGPADGSRLGSRAQHAGRAGHGRGETPDADARNLVHPADPVR